MIFWTGVFSGAYLITLFFLARWEAGREGYYSTITVFGIGGFIYYIAIPVETAFFDSDLVSVAGGLRPDEGLVIVVSALAALISFAFGYRLSRFYPFSFGNNEDGQVVKLPLSIMALLVFCLTTLLLAYREEIRTIFRSYQGNYETTYLNPGFSLLIMFTTISLSVIGGFYLNFHHRKWWLAIPLLLAVFSFGIQSSNKGPMLIALLASVSFYAGKQSKSVWRLVGVIAGVVILLILLPVFSMIRSEMTFAEAADGFYFSFTRIDPAGPMSSLVDTISERQEPRLGMTYLNSFWLWVPRSLWPDRPLDLAEEYARETIRGWQPGQGRGYSLMAEAFVNFGWVGPILQYLIIGYLWGKSWGWLKTILLPVAPAYWRTVYGTIGFYVLIIMHRGPVAGLMKQSFQVFAALVLLSFLFDRRARSNFQSRTMGP